MCAVQLFPDAWLLTETTVDWFSAASFAWFRGADDFCLDVSLSRLLCFYVMSSFLLVCLIRFVFI